MATAKQKRELVAALKFTPRDIEITLWGYGGEIVLGRIPEEAYDFWQGRDDLADFAYDWDGEFGHVPADARFITDGAWHDIDDICHESGCEASDACSINVTDALEDREIWSSNLDLDNLAAKGVDIQAHDHYRPHDDEPDGTCVFTGQSFEKGVFFSGTVRITEPFDPAKLSISWIDCDGWRLISGVTYDGEEVDGYGAYSTTGKSSHFEVSRVEREDEEWNPQAELEKILVDMPVLEGEEMWAQEAIDSAEPEMWGGIPVTPWWPASQDPLREGEYEVVVGTWPFPQRAHWDGVLWKQDDQLIIINQWRGLARPVKKRQQNTASDIA